MSRYVIKENIEQPTLPDVFRRGENSCTINFGNNPEKSLTEIYCSIYKFIRYSQQTVRNPENYRTMEGKLTLAITSNQLFSQSFATSTISKLPFEVF